VPSYLQPETLERPNGSRQVEVAGDDGHLSGAHAAQQQRREPGILEGIQRATLAMDPRGGHAQARQVLAHHVGLRAAVPPPTPGNQKGIDPPVPDQRGSGLTASSGGRARAPIRRQAAPQHYGKSGRHDPNHTVEIRGKAKESGFGPDCLLGVSTTFHSLCRPQRESLPGPPFKDSRHYSTSPERRQTRGQGVVNANHALAPNQGAGSRAAS